MMSWDEAQQQLIDMGCKVPDKRFQDAQPEHYVKKLGWHTAVMQMAEL